MDINKEMVQFFKEVVPALARIADGGVILRDKPVSKAGSSSGCVFVPKYLIGQRVRIIIVPEDTEVAGLKKSLAVKEKKLVRLRKDITKLKNQEAELVDSPEEKSEEDELEENLEEEDSY